MREVSVLGIGETNMGVLKGVGLRDMIKEAGDKAISDSGVDRNAIQALYVGNFNSSYLCGQSLVGGLAEEALMLPDVPNIRIEAACGSGGLAFRQAWLAVASGLYDCVIAGGAEKMTHADTPTVTTGIASAEDYELEALKGITFPGIFAFNANRYMYEYGLTREQLAHIPVQSHKNALKNPTAQMHKEIDVDKVINGVKVADPFTIYDCSLVTDGAAFTILCASEKIGSYTGRKSGIVDVIGSGHGGTNLTVANKNLTSFASAKKAAKEAYGMAGLKPEDIDLAEVHDCFSITQIINTEDLGFFAPGTGGVAAVEGKTAIGGQIPINTSGGLKAKGHPIGATGISQIYEAVTQLRGEAGERQVKDAEIGLTHNLGGSAVVCVIHIFKRR
jgi:acetyl-CoA C-acetyltransferase